MHKLAILLDFILRKVLVFEMDPTAQFLTLTDAIFVFLLLVGLFYRPDLRKLHCSEFFTDRSNVDFICHLQRFFDCLFPREHAFHELDDQRLIFFISVVT